MLSTKYIPDSYDDLIVNENIITILQSNLNVILYGPSGSGKTTMIKTLLKHKGNDKYLVIKLPVFSVYLILSKKGYTL